MKKIALIYMLCRTLKNFLKRKANIKKTEAKVSIFCERKLKISIQNYWLEKTKREPIILKNQAKNKSFL